MPHIDIKCYPKGLSEADMKAFADDLTAFVSERLSTPPSFITIAYTEIAPESWKAEVYDAEIRPEMDRLLRKPEYDM